MEAGNEARKKLSLQYINGFPISARFSRKCFEEAMSLEARPGDIFLVGYPKTGTTWTQYIIWDIINNGAPLPSVNDIWTKQFPHIEMTGASAVSSLPSPRLMKTNLPLKYTPYHQASKYIYNLRNPYDTCVSYYNFLKEVDSNYNSATFDDFFETFMEGDVGFGDYFEHVLSWYAHWNDQNFLFVSYEDMKQNASKSILRIAAFLDKSYYDHLFSNPDILTAILGNTNFNQMKENCPLCLSSSVSSTGSAYEATGVTESKPVNLFRKGSVGQWRAYFSGDEIKRMKAKIQDNFQGTEILSFWDNLGLP